MIGVGAGNGPLQSCWCLDIFDFWVLGITLPQLCLQVIVGLSAPPFKVLPGIFRQSHPLAGRDAWGRFEGRLGLQGLTEPKLVGEQECVEEPGSVGELEGVEEPEMVGEPRNVGEPEGVEEPE